MKKTIKTALILFIWAVVNPAFGYVPLNLIDTPTTETLPKGHYHIYFSSYEGGGIKTKVAIGLSDRFTLGISEDVGGAIGDGRVQWNIPGVMAKFNIFRVEQGQTSGLGWAVGYDYFIEGEYGKTGNLDPKFNGNDVVYGIYSTFNLPFKLFGPGQSFSFGCRYPLVPLQMEKDFGSLTLFSGLDIPFNRELRLALEIEEFSLLDMNDLQKRLMLNFGLRYVAGDLLGVAFNFRFLPGQRSLSRVVMIEYQNLFF